MAGKGISKLGVAVGGGAGLLGGTWAAVRLARGRGWKPTNILLLSTGIQAAGGYAVGRYLKMPSVGLGMIGAAGVSGIAYLQAKAVHQRADIPALANAQDNIANGFLLLTNPEVIFDFNDALDALPAGASAEQVSTALSNAQNLAVNGAPTGLPSGGASGGTNTSTNPIVWNAR